MCAGRSWHRGHLCAPLGWGELAAGRWEQEPHGPHDGSAASRGLLASRWAQPLPTDQQLEAEILPGLGMQLINAEASFYAGAVRTQAAGKQRGVQVSTATAYLNAFQAAHAPFTSKTRRIF